MVEIGFGSTVHCTDGICGHVEGIAIEKKTLKVIDLLVNRGVLSPREIVVPFDVVRYQDSDNVNIELTIGELERLPDLTETELVPISGKLPHHAGHQDEAVVLTTPEIAQGVPLTPVDAELEEPLLEEDIRNVPVGAAVILKSTRVKARGELVGSIAKVIIDPVTGRITELLVRSHEGSKMISLPASSIVYLEDKGINLKLSKGELEKSSHP